VEAQRANATNLAAPRLAGVRFLALAESSGVAVFRWPWRATGRRPRPVGELPHATLVGAAELGYDAERPRYKRKPARLPAAQWRRERAANCDVLIGRLGRLGTADPPLRLRSYPVTRQLAEQPPPAGDAAYKHREDLIDALLCAWTAALWARHGLGRCQILGPAATAEDTPAATIIVPARPEQRR
jgi:predicted RNase H-like nuclease